MRMLTGVAGAALLMGALLGCSSEAPSTSPIDTATTSPIAMATTSPVVMATTSPVDAAPQPDTTSQPEANAMPPAPPTRNDATVDARDYQTGPDTYYFQSADHAIKCGIVFGGSLDGVGCQSYEAPVPESMSDCTPLGGNKAIAAQITDGQPRNVCLNQGVWVGPPVDGTNEGGGAVLADGDVLIVRGTACRAEPQGGGISCFGASNGFTLGRGTNVLF